MFIAMLGVLLLGSTPIAQSADGSAGSISVSANSILDGEVISVWAYDLTASGDYHLNWTGDNTGITFTAGSSGGDYVVDIALSKPAAASSVTVYLRAGSAGTEIAKVTVTVQSISTFLNTALIIGAGVALLMAGAIYAIVKRLG